MYVYQLKNGGKKSSPASVKPSLGNDAEHIPHPHSERIECLVFLLLPAAKIGDINYSPINPKTASSPGSRILIFPASSSNFLLYPGKYLVHKAAKCLAMLKVKERLKDLR